MTQDMEEPRHTRQGRGHRTGGHAALHSGMLGSRKKGNELRDIYSGQEQVPIRAGRWWEVGSTAFEGARIKEWRPQWSILHKSHAEDRALYGSEEEKWMHHPILHSRPGYTLVFPYSPPSRSTTDNLTYSMLSK